MTDHRTKAPSEQNYQVYFQLNPYLFCETLPSLIQKTHWHKCAFFFFFIIFSAELKKH